MGIQGSLQFKVSENYIREINLGLEDFYDGKKNNRPIFEIKEISGLSIRSYFPNTVSICIEKPDSTFINFSSDDNEQKVCEGREDSFVPGDYQIYFVYSLKKVEAFFRVNPTALSSKQLYDLRSAIEGFQTGLTRDIYSKRKKVDFLSFDSTIGSQYILLQRLEEYEKSLFSQLEQVIQNPNISITKGYQIGSEERRQDNRSERWLEIKGERKNSHNEIQTVFLNRHTQQDYQSKENQKLKSELVDLKYWISDLIKILDQKRLFYLAHISRIKVDVVEKEQYLQGTSVDLEKKAVQKDIQRRETEVVEFNDRYRIVNEKITFLRNTKRKLTELLENSWLNQVRIINFYRDFLFSNDSSYQRIFRMFDEIKGFTRKRSEVAFDVDAQYRRTPYLFEVYNLLLLHTAILSLGYQAEDTEIFQVNYGFIDAIIESTLVYKLNDYRIEIRYDKQIPKYSRNTSSEFYNINARHNKPDILVAKFDNNSGVLLDAFVIELKCVKEHYLYSGYEHTSLIEQFKDYLSFAYLDKSNQEPILRKGIIRKVLVVYPNEDEDTNITEFGQIEYLGINPSVLHFDTKLYKFLIEEISYII